MVFPLLPAAQEFLPEPRDVPDGLEVARVDEDLRGAARRGDASVFQTYGVLDVDARGVGPDERGGGVEDRFAGERDAVVVFVVVEERGDVLPLKTVVVEPEAVRKLGVGGLEEPGIVAVPGDLQGVGLTELETARDADFERRRVTGFAFKLVLELGVSHDALSLGAKNSFAAETRPPSAFRRDAFAAQVPSPSTGSSSSESVTGMSGVIRRRYLMRRTPARRSGRARRRSARRRMKESWTIPGRIGLPGKCPR